MRRLVLDPFAPADELPFDDRGRFRVAEALGLLLDLALELDPLLDVLLVLDVLLDVVRPVRPVASARTTEPSWPTGKTATPFFPPLAPFFASNTTIWSVMSNRAARILALWPLVVVTSYTCFEVMQNSKSDELRLVQVVIQ